MIDFKIISTQNLPKLCWSSASLLFSTLKKGIKHPDQVPCTDYPPLHLLLIKKQRLCATFSCFHSDEISSSKYPFHFDPFVLISTSVFAIKWIMPFKTKAFRICFQETEVEVHQFFFANKDQSWRFIHLKSYRRSWCFPLSSALD